MTPQERLKQLFERLQQPEKTSRFEIKRELRALLHVFDHVNVEASADSLRLSDRINTVKKYRERIEDAIAEAGTSWPPSGPLLQYVSHAEMIAGHLQELIERGPQT